MPSELIVKSFFSPQPHIRRSLRTLFAKLVVLEILFNYPVG